MDSNSKLKVGGYFVSIYSQSAFLFTQCITFASDPVVICVWKCIVTLKKNLHKKRVTSALSGISFHKKEVDNEKIQAGAELCQAHLPVSSSSCEVVFL